MAPGVLRLVAARDGHHAHVGGMQQQIFETCLEVDVSLLKWPDKHLKQTQLAGNNVIRAGASTQSDWLQEGAIRLDLLVAVDNRIRIEVHASARW
jgi:hypothetical protein